MNREELKKYKELKKYLENKTKEVFKTYNLKKKDYMFYLSKNNMFYSIMFSMFNNTIKVYFYAKPLWIDDILWDILNMSSNKTAPISLRSVGAFTINSQIKIKEYNVENEKEINNVVNGSFNDLLELSNIYDEDYYLSYYTNISYQKEMIYTIVLIHNKEYEKALNFLNNTKVSGFVSNNKCFSDLAIEYINKM